MVGNNSTIQVLQSFRFIKAIRILRGLRVIRITKLITSFKRLQ